MAWPATCHWEIGNSYHETVPKANYDAHAVINSGRGFVASQNCSSHRKVESQFPFMYSNPSSLIYWNAQASRSSNIQTFKQVFPDATSFRKDVPHIFQEIVQWHWHHSHWQWEKTALIPNCSHKSTKNHLEVPKISHSLSKTCFSSGIFQKTKVN